MVSLDVSLIHFLDKDMMDDQEEQVVAPVETQEETLSEAEALPASEEAEKTNDEEAAA